jgi:ribosomal protein S6
MDPKTAAEELPELYRALLDRIAQIDATGHRRLAYRIREKATRIYSRAWDDRARRGLEELLRQSAEKGSAQRQPLRGSHQRSAPVA